MKFNWNEMSPAQKRESIIVLVLAMIGMVFAILDLSGKWPNNLTYLAISVLSLFEGITAWNKNRKLAVTDLVVGIVLIVVKILTTIL